MARLMGLFLLRYHPAYDRAHTKPGQPVPIEQIELAADGCWNVADVTDAFLHQRPGTEVLSCIADPHTIAA